MMNVNVNTESQESKKNKLFELKTKYKSLLTDLNSSSLFDKLSDLDPNKLTQNKKIDYLITENLQIQSNIEFLQNKLSNKLDNFEYKITDKDNFVNEINDVHFDKKVVEKPTIETNEKLSFGNDIDLLKKELELLNNHLSDLSSKNAKLANNEDEKSIIISNKEIDESNKGKIIKGDIDFLKNEIISLNNILLQINNDINKKLDISISELSSIYLNLKTEIENLSNKELHPQYDHLSKVELGSDVLDSLNNNIKIELTAMRDSFDKKLDDLKNHFEFEPFFKENYFKIKNQNSNYQDKYVDIPPTAEKKVEEEAGAPFLYNNNEINTYYSNKINLDEKDLQQILFNKEEEPKSIFGKKSELKINSEAASIESLEKQFNLANAKLNKTENLKNYAGSHLEKFDSEHFLEIESKWNSIVSNMEINTQLITDENKFLKSKFDELQVKYEELKNEYIKKNEDAINVEKALSITNHKFNELANIIDQQDAMMKSLQEENKLFFNNFKYNKEDINDKLYLSKDSDEILITNSISSNLKNIEKKLIDLQFELNEIDSNSFDALIKQYDEKVVK